MPTRPDDSGSWSFAEELLERGEPAFVAELRRITDADRLGIFAARWYGDRRPASRQLLLDYLGWPLNAYRHEALVKRLFKLAENAGDDEVMGAFLAAFDRSLRRQKYQRYRNISANFTERAKAEAQLREWGQQGFDSTNLYEWNDRFNVHASWTEEALRVPQGTTIWRPTGPQAHKPSPLSDGMRSYYEKRWLFSVATRRYLRRRAWRYFRKLGKQHPERYVPAAASALKRYEDADSTDGLALLDNWGLMHLLFHHSPVLQSHPLGWTLADGRKLAELAPAPIYESLWKTAPRTFLDLVKEARARPVRQWAIHMIRRDHGALIDDLPLEELLALLGHADPEVVSLAVEVLRHAHDLSGVPMERWLALLDTPNPEILGTLCDLLATRLGPDRLAFDQVVRLAASRPMPLARLGFAWLQNKSPASEADCQVLLRLVEAEAEPLRPDIVRWLRTVLGNSPHFQPAWVLEYLDCRHADVRAEGWHWLQEEPRARDNVDVWQKLLESPYDDVRLQLIEDLENRWGKRHDSKDADKLDGEMVRFLWASVLLNIHRGGRKKPLVVQQLVRRLSRRPEEAGALLPILSVALRSLRGPEWRAGLVGVVQLAERNPDLLPLVNEKFPELQLFVG